MSIDANIYSGVQAPQPNSAFDSYEKAMRLSELGMQQAQMGQQMYQQGVLRHAYAQNTDPNTGKLDRAGFLSTLGQAAPQLAEEKQAQFAQQDKVQAEAQLQQMQATHQMVSTAVPYLDYLENKVPQDQKAKVYPQLRQQMANLGLPVDQYLPQTYDGPVVRSTLQIANQQKEQLDKFFTEAQIGKIQSETGDVADKRVQALKDDLDPDKNKGTNLAANQARVYQAQRLKGLLQQTGGNPDQRQMEELAIGAQQMISNGNSSIEQVKALVPKTAWGNSKKMYEWFHNEPTGTDQQAFVQRLADSIDREEQIATNQVKQTQVARAGAHRLLQRTNPQAFYDQLHSWGIEPQNIQNGKYVSGGNNNTMAGGDSTPSSSGIPGISNANASEGTRQPPSQKSITLPTPPQGTIWMKTPKGGVKAIPLSQKGEAIAAGGSVVK